MLNSSERPYVVEVLCGGTVRKPRLVDMHNVAEVGAGREGYSISSRMEIFSGTGRKYLRFHFANPALADVFAELFQGVRLEVSGNSQVSLDVSG